jgi:hypothetical protein
VDPTSATYSGGDIGERPARGALALHYRFDIEAGQELGREVAEWAIANDVVGHEPFPLD